MSLSAETQAAQLLAFLPTYSRALSLVDLCFSNPSWFIPTTEKSEVIEDLFPIFYKEARVGGSSGSGGGGGASSSSAAGANSKFGPGKMHDLALLFALFANGTLVDHSQPVVNTEGLKYHQLCRAALGVHPILEYASLSAIEALLQISIFVTRLCDKNFQEYAWGTVSLAINLASVVSFWLFYFSVFWGEKFVLMCLVWVDVYWCLLFFLVRWGYVSICFFLILRF